MIKKLKKVLHRAKPAATEEKEGGCTCGCGCCDPAKKAGVLVAALVVAGLVGFVSGRLGCGGCEGPWSPQSVTRTVVPGPARAPVPGLRTCGPAGLLRFKTIRIASLRPSAWLSLSEGVSRVQVYFQL